MDELPIDDNTEKQALWDGIVFKGFVDSMPEEFHKEFKRLLNTHGISYTGNVKRIHKQGIGEKTAQNVFCISSEAQGKPLKQLLREYVQYCDKIEYNPIGFSGHDKALETLLNEIPLTPPTYYLPEELVDSTHDRLRPLNSEFLGRIEEVKAVLSFLNNSKEKKCVCVEGLAGIGKTEICKAALKKWLALESQNRTRAFWMRIEDDADSARLLQRMGEAVGLPQDELAKISNFPELRNRLYDGLYYLDNLESIAESGEGQRLLQEMAVSPGLRILASSRSNLDHCFGVGSGIRIDNLETSHACELFLRHWKGSTTPKQDELETFIEKELGGHPLSIILLARLGSNSFEILVGRWKEEGTVLASPRKVVGREYNLQISLSLTKKMLVSEPGALDLWQFIALFPDGCDENAVSSWGIISGQQQARDVLSDHHIFSIERGHIFMLPPIARYAREHVVIRNLPDQDFNWVSARNFSYLYFINMSHDAASNINSQAKIESRSMCSQNLWPIYWLVRLDIFSRNPNLELMRHLHIQLHDVYQFNPPASLDLLVLIHQIFSDSLSSYVLGCMESMRGNMEIAREYFLKTIDSYRGSSLELKHVGYCYHKLATIEQINGNFELSNESLELAINLFKSCNDQFGLAITLREMGRFRGALNDYLAARKFFKLSLAIFQELDNQRELGITTLDFSKLGVNSGNYNAALEKAEEALDIFRKEKYQVGEAEGFYILGLLKFQSKDYPQSHTFYKHSLTRYKSIGYHEKDVGDVQVKLGEIEVARGVLWRLVIFLMML